MKIQIRPYRETDFEVISSWWTEHDEIGPAPGMMITDGTFVLEVEGTPILSLTVFLTQSREMAYLEGFVSRPGLDPELRRMMSQLIWEHALGFARANGYKRAIIYTNKEKLVERYEGLGMTRSPVTGLTALWKEL